MNELDDLTDIGQGSSRLAMDSGVWRVRSWQFYANLVTQIMRTHIATVVARFLTTSVTSAVDVCRTSLFGWFSTSSQSPPGDPSPIPLTPPPALL